MPSRESQKVPEEKESTSVCSATKPDKEKETTKETAEEERREVAKVLPLRLDEVWLPRFVSTAASLVTLRKIAGRLRKAKVITSTAYGVERKEDEPEAETSSLEISMIEDTAIDTSVEEGEAPVPHVGNPKLRGRGKAAIPSTTPRGSHGGLARLSC